MNRFSAHLEQVEESYLQHMKHALSFALNLGVASVVCLVHAFLPFLFEKQGSAIVSKMHDRMVVNRQNLTGSEKKNISRRWISNS
ncbi:MAG: DUF6356 family protein [Pseudomonadales bacterium]|nr:DUF6356 family protein [Pseudomonadales bacterium]